MLLAALAFLLLLFVVLPVTGVALATLIGAVFTGLVIGGLGRLVVPGQQPIGCLLTIVTGLSGAMVGTLIGHALGTGPLGTFLLEVAVAAALVAVVAGRGRRARW